MRGWLKFALLIVVVVGLPVTLYFLYPKPANHLALAKEAIARRDFAAAQRELDTFLKEAPRHPEALLLAAQSARRAGDYDTAAKHLSAFRAAGGSREEVELEEALRDSQQGFVGNAPQLLQFCRSNADNPSVSMMLEALAQGLLKTPNSGLAIDCVDLWLQRPLTPADQAQGHVWRGQALEMRGLAPEAAEDYRKALVLDPKNPEARLRLAQFLTRDDPKEAVTIFEQLNAETPNQAPIRLGLARCYRLLGELRKAETLLAELRQQAPEDVSVLIESGALLIDQGNADAAEPLLRKAVALAPKRRDPNAELLRCLRALRKDEEAKQQEAKVNEIDAEIQRKIDTMTKKK